MNTNSRIGETNKNTKGYLMKIIKYINANIAITDTRHITYSETSPTPNRPKSLNIIFDATMQWIVATISGA